MSGSVDARAAWLERVLGYTPPGTGQEAGAGTQASAAGWQAARDAWQAASEVVDGQIAGLQAVLRRTGDDRLEEIAEFGLNGITGNHRAKLMAMLLELGNGDAATLQKIGPKALGLIDAFRSHLESSEAVEVCDGNPFGAPVAIRATLVPALVQMTAALQAATRP